MRYRIIIEMDAKNQLTVSKFARFITDGKDGIVYVSTEEVLDGDGHSRSWHKENVIERED